VRAIAGGTPEQQVAREGRVDALISEAVQEWVRVTGEAAGGANWQQRAEAYARILRDETVRATVLPDGTPLVKKVGAWREFAEAMGQAEAKLARQNFGDALAAYDYAAGQAREDSDRRAASDGREKARTEWIESFRRKISEARVLDSAEFYEQVIRPLSEMARVLGLSPEEAFRLVTGR
jgi:hypothetical protein